MIRACSMYIFSDQTLLRSFVICGRYLRANSSSCCISLISFVQSTFLLLLLFFSPTSYTLLLRYIHLKAYLLKLFLPEKYILEEISYFDSGLKWKYCVNIRHTSALKPQTSSIFPNPIYWSLPCYVLVFTNFWKTLNFKPLKQTVRSFPELKWSFFFGF